METKLEQIAVKARNEPNLRFTSLAHHITRDRVLENLSKIPKRSAAGVDGQTVEAAKESFEEWIEPMLQSIHRQGYRAPDIRRVYIPKPGKTEKRPLGVPTVSDRALQRSTAEVLSAIYEQDFLPCSFGGRPKLSAHHALATLNEVIAGGMAREIGRKSVWQATGGQHIKAQADAKADAVRSPRRCEVLSSSGGRFPAPFWRWRRAGRPKQRGRRDRGEDVHGCAPLRVDH